MPCSSSFVAARMSGSRNVGPTGNPSNFPGTSSRPRRAGFLAGTRFHNGEVVRHEVVVLDDDFERPGFDNQARGVVAHLFAHGSNDEDRDPEFLEVFAGGGGFVVRQKTGEIAGGLEGLQVVFASPFPGGRIWPRRGGGRGGTGLAFGPGGARQGAQALSGAATSTRWEISWVSSPNVASGSVPMLTSARMAARRRPPAGSVWTGDGRIRPGRIKHLRKTSLRPLLRTMRL